MKRKVGKLPVGELSGDASMFEYVARENWTTTLFLESPNS